MHLESKIAWLACAIDSEGTIQVTKQRSVNMPTSAYSLCVMIYNADEAYLSQCLSFLADVGVSVSWVSSRRTSKISKKNVGEIRIQGLEDVIAVLQKTIPFLTTKKAFASAVLGLAILREQSREARGARASWTESEMGLAEYIRKTFMPYSKCANGETETGEVVLSAIPSEALGSETSTKEPLETRPASIASGNLAQECPASHRDEDIVRSSGKPESGDKEPRADIAI